VTAVVSGIDQNALQAAVVQAVEEVLAPILPPGVEAVLTVVLGPLISWVAAEVTRGADPKPKILMLALSSADAAADAAEAAKFPQAADSDTKP
jgi:hypothetical protein